MTMHHQTLYSLRTDGDQFRITKFVDGEVESSYLCSEVECECPAGHRPSCRHRQMLPMMLATGIVNSHWFWDFDMHRACDFEGNLKSNFDAMQALVDAQPKLDFDALNELAAEPKNITATEIEERYKQMPPLHDPMIEYIVDKAAEAVKKIHQSPSRSWRRL